jgi:hypothetical protein
MSKRPLKKVWGMYLYSPQLIPTVTCQLSKICADWTRRSTWPDVFGQCNGRIWNRQRWVTGRTDQGWPDMSGRARTLLYFDRTLNRVWSVMTGCVWSAKYLTGTRPDALWTCLIVFQSCPISSLTLYDTCQHDQRVRSSQGPRPVNQVEIEWLSALTGRVWSRQRLRPVKGKRLKRLRNATQLEPSCFQLNFGLHLSYLVLSSTSVHHT